MRSTIAAWLLALVLALVLALGGTGPAGAQDPPPSGPPTQDIVPPPNTGDAPQEAGDRGGVLQLLLPALILAAIGGGAWHLRRQARAARGETATSHSSSRASHGSTPSTKPDR
ncbi:MAG: hypothetical protein ABWZ76_01160 [Acidimicrobiales bacterium]